MCFYELQIYEETIKDCQSSIELDEENYKNHYIMGKAFCQLGRKDLSAKLVENGILRITKAYTLSGKANKKDAERDLEQTLKRVKKVKFFIEREIYNKEAQDKY